MKYDKNLNKMKKKQNLNEIKRMQQLAGIKPLNENLGPDGFSEDEVMRILNDNDAIWDGSVEAGGDSWMSVITDITGEDPYEGDLSPEADAKVAAFMRKMSEMGIEVN